MKLDDPECQTLEYLISGHSASEPYREDVPLCLCTLNTVLSWETGL